LVGRRDGGCPAERPAGHPAVGRGRRGRQGQDACHGVGRRPASTMWFPRSGSVVRVRRSSRPVSSPSGVQPVWCPARPVSSPSGVQPVRCPARLVSSPSGVQPVRCPPVRRPAGYGPPPSVRTRPARPTSGGGGGTRSRRRTTVTTGTGRGLGGLPRLGAAGWTAEQARTQAMLPRSRWSVGRWRTRARWGDGGRPRLTG
jgi:hypothetical protein